MSSLASSAWPVPSMTTSTSRMDVPVAFTSRRICCSPPDNVPAMVVAVVRQGRLISSEERQSILADLAEKAKDL